ncbi:unnamed protein product [marine sediment metagenome]|uniref:Uncharacterized protein n=1 Tax=marine sediment metagenome TaxID=412755 RepID=X1CZW6_9ZZZZ
MTNPEYLAGIKQADDIWHKDHKISFIEITNEDWYEYINSMLVLLLIPSYNFLKIY